MQKELYKFIPDEELIGTDVVSSLSETVGWGLLLSGVDLFWQESKGEGIKIAVLDTGVSFHNDLEGQVIERYDSTGSGIEPSTFHGTHVAGIISAKANDIGVIGIAPESKLYSVKVLGAGGKGSFDSILAGLKICESIECSVINMSLGTPIVPPDEIHSQIKKLYAQGKIIIAAAGNNAAEVNYPALYPEVIAVAALDQSQKLAKFSSHGPKVSVSAPGVDIYSCWGTNEYKIMSGTSQAAPFFSGICALLLSYSKKYPDKIQLNNFNDLLNLLDTMCDPNTNEKFSGTLADTGFGIPNFANILPWRTNA